MNNKKLTLTLALTVGFVSPTAPILAANISTTVLASGLNIAVLTPVWHNLTFAD